VEEEIFQTWFRNVNVGQLRARIRGQIRDLRNEGTAAVRIDVGPRVVGSAYLADSRQRLQPAKQFRRLFAETKAQQESAGNRCLQLPRCTHGNHVAVVNNGQALAQRVG